MLNGLHITLGQATDSHATIYVRPVSQQFDPNWRLRGTLRGPRCLYARTLPTEFLLEDLGHDPTPLARAELHEPCYWTPDLPYLYELTVEVFDGDRELASMTLTTGFRRFAVERARFWLDGRPHVLRAWRAPEPLEPEAIAWNGYRQAQLSLWCDAPSGPLLDAAAVHGVMVATEQPLNHPSPALTVLPPESVCFSEMPMNACLLGGVQAVVARRYDHRIADCVSARAACEQLQRDCAPYTDLAGYVV